MEAVAQEVQAPVRFAREAIASVIGEISPLTATHWEEVGHYRDLALDPDFERYALFERQGTLRLYTARTDSLVGYALYLLSTALHYRQTITAQQSTLYLHPTQRKGTTGAQFIAWTERELVKEGVQIITQHVKARHDAKGTFRKLLERRGYELQDYVMTKRLL